MDVLADRDAPADAGADADGAGLAGLGLELGDEAGDGVAA
jgi:hypothetical protein